MTNKFDLLAPLAECPDPAFDELWAHLRAKIPALAEEGGTLEMPYAGLKKAVKFAFVAGGVAAAEKLTGGPVL
jgi:hypothetical protein